MKKISIFLLFQILTIILFAQGGDKSALQKEKENLKGELAALQKEYNTIVNSKQRSLASLRIIQDKIEVRNRLINNISNEVNLIDRDLTKTQRSVNSLNAKLDTLKQEYAKSIVYAYKNRNNYDFLTFIFSANNFNDALKRIQYLKEYRNYRARQAEDIRKYKDILLGQTKELDTKKKEKNSVLQNQSVELNELAGEKSELNSTVQNFTSNQNLIAKEIAKAKTRQSRITAQIIAINKREELVRKKALEAERKRLKDIADAQAKAEAKARADAAKANKANPTKPPTKPTVTKPKVEPKPKVEEPLYTPAEVNANATFEQNKGRMNYPLQGGYIRTRFGIQDLGGVKWNNEGTTFESSSPGATVTAIFNGIIKTVQIDDDTKTIFISHGRYISVYGNLSNVNVSVGQAVTAGQVIGKCAASEETAGRGLLELMMFKDNKIENPERWLRR